MSKCYLQASHWFTVIEPTFCLSLWSSALCFYAAELTLYFYSFTHLFWVSDISTDMYLLSPCYVEVTARRLPVKSKGCFITMTPDFASVSNQATELQANACLNAGLCLTEIHSRLADKTRSGIL